MQNKKVSIWDQKTEEIIIPELMDEKDDYIISSVSNPPQQYGKVWETFEIIKDDGY